MPPANPQRIALINPTKFLGNLLMAGHLIQTFCQYCQQHNVQVLVVLDETFAELFADAFAGARLVLYPRQALNGKNRIAGLRGWLRCVKKIRAFRADIAFTIEEDSVCHRLTHLSGARYKVSSTVHRYHYGFDEVLDIARSGRASDESSIWFSFCEVFQRLGFPVATLPRYVELAPPVARAEWLTALGLDARGGPDANARPVAVIHAGASKPYKRWPLEHFVTLARLLLQRGYQLALIGAGSPDAEANQAIVRQLGNSASIPGESSSGVRGADCVDLCNRLSLAALASLLTQISLIVGNDSGPSHLASALGVRGAVIFGPTDVSIWQPLSAHTRVLHNKSACLPDCTRHHCQSDYLCLQSIGPAQVMAALFDDQKT